MVDIFSTALSGLNASQNRASTSASNLANLNTPGYRAQRAHTAIGPNGVGAITDSTQISNAATSLRPTGNPLDLAIQGPGYFQLNDGAGNAYYTRDGSFSVGPEGTLVNSQGLAVAPGLNIPAGAESVTIGQDGTVSAQINGQGQVLGRLQLANFNNPGGLAPQGGNLAQPTPAAGAPMAGPAGEGGRGFVISGFLEGSNVDLIDEIVNQIVEPQIYRANAAVVRTADEMQRETIDLIG